MSDTALADRTAIESEDPALASRNALEAAGVKAALANRGGRITYAIVAVVNGEKVSLVTDGDLTDRRHWFQILGLPTGFIEDIDADYGVGYIDENGAAHLAGPNLEFAAEARANAQRYQQRTPNHIGVVGEDPKAQTDFACYGYNTTGELVTKNIPRVTPRNRRVILGLNNLVGPDGRPGDHVGVAWRMPDGVIILTGRAAYTHWVLFELMGWQKY